MGLKEVPITISGFEETEGDPPTSGSGTLLCTTVLMGDNPLIPIAGNSASVSFGFASYFC